MEMLQYGLCVLVGYLFGSSNMAFYLACFKGVDMRAGGSGNLGTSNAVILLGKGAGVLVLVHDVLKATVAALLCGHFFPQLAYAGAVAGAAAVAGHILPFYLKFKGGKGFASYIGALLALDWKFAIVMILIIIAAAFLFDWIVAGTFAAISLSPLYFLMSARLALCLILTAASLLIFMKHIENIKRKLQGKEIGVRQALFKKA